MSERIKGKDIVFESEHSWVLAERNCYTVLRNTDCYSFTDSSYPKTEDGLSIALARAKYITKRAKEREGELE